MVNTPGNSGGGMSGGMMGDGVRGGGMAGMIDGCRDMMQGGGMAPPAAERAVARRQAENALAGRQEAAMTRVRRTELVIPAIGRPQRVGSVHRSLAAVHGVVRVESGAAPGRIVVIHALADELPLVAVLAGLGYAARGVTVADEVTREVAR